MSNTLDNKDNSTDYFATFFASLKDEIGKRFDNKNDDQLSYRSLAFRDAVNSFPCPVDIAKLRVDRAKYFDAESEIYYLVKYDLSRFGDFSVVHHGEFDLENIQNHSELVKRFDLNDQRIDDIKTLRLIYYDDVEHWLWCWLVSKNALENLEKYSRDFLFFFNFTFKDSIQDRFGKEIDYAIKYGLKNDSILSPSELLRIDNAVNSIFKPRKDEESHKLLEDLQCNISEIQLSPKVPENVKKVFNAAKRLYVFGYFEYYFFTISEHYAFLAVESALRNKFTELFGKPKKFVNLDTIITRLLEAKVIREAEKPFYDISKRLRNSLSHLTRPSVLMPNAKILESTAFFINQIYEDHKYR